MQVDTIQPAGWKQPKGYSNGVSVSGAGSLLFVAGQIAWDAQQKLVGGGDFAAQFAQTLRNVVSVVNAAGGDPRHIVRMTIYVTSKREYLAATSAVGNAWREIIGKHYPAMALVEVAGLLEEGALVEIEATAVLARS
jgi:enamine deaminase RidA (YjgF/YER057c/UK114 family)